MPFLKNSRLYKTENPRMGIFFLLRDQDLHLGLQVMLYHYSFRYPKSGFAVWTIPSPFLSCFSKVRSLPSSLYTLSNNFNIGFSSELSFCLGCREDFSEFGKCSLNNFSLRGPFSRAYRDTASLSRYRVV